MCAGVQLYLCECAGVCAGVQLYLCECADVLVCAGVCMLEAGVLVCVLV